MIRIEWVAEGSQPLKDSRSLNAKRKMLHLGIDAGAIQSDTHKPAGCRYIGARTLSELLSDISSSFPVIEDTVGRRGRVQVVTGSDGARVATRIGKLC